MKSFLYSIIFILLINQILSFSRKPIIGIVTNPYPENDDSPNSLTFLNYHEFIEQIGCKVLPLLYTYDEDTLKYIIPKLNGLLFQGGSRDLRLSSPFEKQSEIIINIARENKIPVWFTCQGFELLHAILTKNTDSLVSSDAWDLLLPATFTSSAKQSRMFKYFSTEDFDFYTKNAHFQNYHHLRIDPSLYVKYPLLNQFIITSLGKDLNGNIFVNSIESRDFNKSKFFAVQFHPEKHSYVKSTPNLGTLEGILMTSKLAASFLDEILKTISSNVLSAEDEAKFGVFLVSDRPVLPENKNFYVYYGNSPL